MKKMAEEMYLGALTLGVVAALLTGCDDSGLPAGATPDNTMVRIEIKGQKFNVPVRYTYKISKEKWGKFRIPKRERVSVDTLSIDVLMPDLRPYYEEDDARWSLKGHGDRVMVSIGRRVGGAGWYKRMVDNLPDDVEKGRYSTIPDVYELSSYENGYSTRHFPTDGRITAIDCTKPKPNYYPSCHAKSEYRDDVVLEYSFSLNNLQKWKEIDDGLKAMVDRFAENASREQAGNAESPMGDSASSDYSGVAPPGA